MNSPADPPIDLRRLRYFVAVAEELHFGRAAARLGISQPPLSEQILALEASLNARLFQRSNRKVALTSAGHVLYREAVNLIAHADRVRGVMRTARSGGLGPLFLGCVPSALFGVLPALLEGWDAPLGGLDLRLTEAHTMDVVSAILEGRLDAGLVWRDRAPSGLMLRPLEEVAMVAALHHANPLARKKSLALADLKNLPLVTSPRELSPDNFDLIQTGFRAAGLMPLLGHATPSISSQLGFVASGLGYSLVPSYAMKLRMKGVKFVTLRGALAATPLAFVYREGRPSAQVQALRERVDAVFPLREAAA